MTKTRLRYWRLRRNFSMDDLAEKAGVTKQTIFNIEHAYRESRPSTRRKLVEALGIDADDFFTTDNDPNADGSSSSENAA